MAEAVEGWRARAQNPVSPEHGSSLAADSLPGLGVESQVWYAMCIASEHLDFAIEAMRATQAMYPTAYMTVTRTAFIAAVNAVWILAPTSRQTRRERALRLRADDLRVQITGLHSMSLPAGPPDAARRELVDQLRERQRVLQQTATQIGIAEDVTKMRFNQTEAIDWVAVHMHGVDDETLIGATQSIWRSGSAAAHAQFYFGLLRTGEDDVVRNETGGRVMRLKGSLDTDVGPALAGAVLTLSEAFRLYDMRRVKHI